MKRFFKLVSAALMALVVCVPAQAETLLVNDGVDYCEYAPIYGGYCDAVNVVSQVIYPASELESLQGSIINKMTFYIANADDNTLSGGKLGFEIGVTDLAEFPGYSPSVVEGLTEVAEISFTPGDSLIVVDFALPYVYTGISLLKRL